MADEQKNTEAPAAAAPAAETAAAEKKNKKIRFMNLKELDEVIENTKKNQGSLNSRYAKELLKRKDFLAAKK